MENQKLTVNVKDEALLDLNSTTMSNKDNALRKRDIANAICLVTGTAIGGAFLALPCVVQPIGFLTHLLQLYLSFGHTFLDNRVLWWKVY